MTTLIFVSLRLHELSLECMQWVLTSLKSDEMAPTERAVQSRIKEAFAYKTEPGEWEAIVAYLTIAQKRGEAS